jgi:hypothetical protein
MTALYRVDGTLVTAEALVGRRVQEWTGEGFGRTGRITHLYLERPMVTWDGSEESEAVDANNVMVLPHLSADAAKKLAQVLVVDHGEAYVHTQVLVNDLLGKFPEHDWLALVEGEKS